MHRNETIISEAMENLLELKLSEAQIKALGSKEEIERKETLISKYKGVLSKFNSEQIIGLLNDPRSGSKLEVARQYEDDLANEKYNAEQIIDIMNKTDSMMTASGSRLRFFGDTEAVRSISGVFIMAIAAYALLQMGQLPSHGYGCA